MRAKATAFVLMLCGFSGLALAAGVATGLGQSEGARFVGTCAASPTLPCSAAGNDSEAAVEAALEQVLGPRVDVTSLAAGLTGAAGEFDLTPSDVTQGRGFEWSYGGASALAFITVKGGDGFAVIGVAGLMSGRVDVSELLGGHDISHVSLWALSASRSEPVAAERLHGKGFLGNARLGEIEGDTVPCVHVDTAEPGRCAFSKRGTRSGSWLEGPDGDFALAGQAISLEGEPGGDYVVAAKLSRVGEVPALEPSGRDSAGTATGRLLYGQFYVETFLSATNASGRRLENYATREVCTSSYPHPDGAALTRSPALGVYCYRGRGAALNDVNGTERNELGVYYPGGWAQHVAWSGGYEVYAAKRPATQSFPAPGIVRADTLIVWRPVSSVPVAN
jgi:hypothetical protein